MARPRSIAVESDRRIYQGMSRGGRSCQVAHKDGAVEKIVFQTSIEDALRSNGIRTSGGKVPSAQIMSSWVNYGVTVEVEPTQSARAYRHSYIIRARMGEGQRITMYNCKDVAAKKSAHVSQQFETTSYG